MKKLLAFMLVFVMVFAFAACNDVSNDESSNDVSSTAPQSSQDDKSVAAEPSSEPASEEPSVEESSEEPSVEPSEEPSKEPEPELPAYIDGFVYVDGMKLAMAPTDAASIRLTKINDVPVAGDVVCFTPEFGTSIAIDGEDYSDYAILVVEYNAEEYQYRKKAIYNLEDTADKSNIEIPADGFVVAIHKDQAKPLAALAKVKDDVEIYPSNFQPYDFSYEVKKTETPFEIDGTIGEEWRDFLVDSIDETNPSWDYSQFDLQTDSPITADYYLAYSDTGIYIGVVVNTPACKWMPGITKDNCGSMYSYTCIQVNTCDQSPLSEYMLKHGQGGIDKTSYNEDHLRQYGFSGSESGESYSKVWMGGTHTTIGEDAKYCAIFDEANEVITYEVYLPYEEINIDPAEIGVGFEFSVSISINSTTTEGGAWKNIRARNGGGIIGMNEFTKMPVCIMG